MRESALIADWFQEHGFVATDVVIEECLRIRIAGVEIGGACSQVIGLKEALATVKLSLLHYPRGTKRGDVARLQRGDELGGSDKIPGRWMIVAVDLHCTTGITEEATVTLRRIDDA